MQQAVGSYTRAGERRRCKPGRRRYNYSNYVHSR
jgi:hypothetical protein